jgi:tRNA 2-thiocytidine biosynthesis protein TtcA
MTPADHTHLANLHGLPTIQFMFTEIFMHTLSQKGKKIYHYTSKAIADFRMIMPGDRILVGLSGGKDSYSLLTMLKHYQHKRRSDFTIHAYTLDQSQPGWDDQAMRDWLESNGFDYTIEKRDTYSVVIDKIKENKTYCSLCSRLRRGNIYRFARDHHYNKVALGHHRDDIIESLLMSMFYNGQVKTMPPKLLSDDQQTMVIRPLAYCQEKDIRAYAAEQKFPLIPCNLCGSQQNLKRVRVKRLLKELSEDNEKVPSNLLHACQSIQPSQMMDKKLWDFYKLDDLQTPNLRHCEADEQREANQPQIRHDLL